MEQGGCKWALVLDALAAMLPGAGYLEPPLWDDVLGLADRAGSVGHQLVAGMHQAIAALALAGVNVVADHVLVEPDWLRQCIRLFSPLPAYFVGVRCPLDVLEQRERERRNRTWGQARLQVDCVHAHGIYDIEVDTSINNPEECARQVIARIRSGDPPTAFSRLKALQEVRHPY